MRRTKGSLIPVELALIEATHNYGFMSARHAEYILGRNYFTISRALKRMAAAGYLTDIGHANTIPSSVHYAKYYTVGNKNPKGMNTVARKPLDKKCGRRNDIITNKGVSIPRHYLWVLHAADWISRSSVEMNIDSTIYSEWVLRKKYGWYSKGEPPANHPDPKLQSIPDLLVSLPTSHLHVEVQLSKKGHSYFKDVYERVLPPSRPVVVICAARDASNNEQDSIDPISVLNHIKSSIATLKRPVTCFNYGDLGGLKMALSNDW